MTTIFVDDLRLISAVFKDLPVGQRIYLDGPFGNFSIDHYPDANSFVFIAGGVGITPMMSMLRTLAERGDTRPLLLIYAANTWDAITFREEIEELTERPNFKVVYAIRNPPENWQGESGYVTKEILARYLPQSRESGDFEVFLCGPEPLTTAVEKALVELGVFIGNFHVERFDLV